MLVAGMCSATLSTLGNEYNVLSGVLTKDFYNRVIRPDADEKRLVLWGRLNTLLIGALTTLLALALIYLKKEFNLIDILQKILGSFGPAIMIPLLAGLIIKRVNSRGAIAGVAAGTISGVSLIVLNAVLLSLWKNRLASWPRFSAYGSARPRHAFPRTRPCGRGNSWPAWPSPASPRSTRKRKPNPPSSW
jgi:Na+/proline symporter